MNREGDRVSEIVNIGLGQIYPHPDNPRKDLGDLTELIASVKENGILQNLTVVERQQGGYTCIIGHRRLAAANAAGLVTVPCRIAELTECEQLAMMISENMQRADLTVYEQAMGVQMMLDLGETVASVSKATGLSETTVRRREKVAQLPEQGLKDAVDRGATLFDLEKLMKVKDDAEREKLLTIAGKDIFAARLDEALKRQKNEENLRKAIKEIATWARQIEEKDVVSGVAVPMDFVTSSYDGNIQKREDADEVRYYFMTQIGSSWFRISLYRDHKETVDEEALRREAKHKEREERAQKLTELTNGYYERRRDFIAEVNVSEKKWPDVLEACFTALTGPRKAPYMDRDPHCLGQMIGAEWHADLKEFDYQALTSRMMESPAKLALTAAWWEMDDRNLGYWRRKWDGLDEGMTNVYSDNPRLDAVYKILKRFGYWTTVEEEQLRLGKHDLFDEEEE